jgi:hypothetical protein
MISSLRSGWIAVALSVATGFFATAAQAGPPSYSFYAGYGKMMESGAPSGNFAFHANAFAMMDPVIGIGGEGGYAWLGSSPTGDPIAGDLNQNVYHFTANVRARGVQGSLRPYGIGGLGLYGLHASDNLGSSTTTKFGFNIGAGLSHKFPDSSTGLGLEARWHLVPDGARDTSTGQTSTLDVLTITAGVDFN